MAFSRTQSAVLAVLPKISSLFSLVGSAWIIVEVLTHGGPQPKRNHPYHRLLLAMSVYDVLECVWNFGSTWPIPKDSGKIWAMGTTATCSAQGFFLTLSSAVPVYNALLAVYYMLVIKYQYSDRILRTRIEPVFHLVAGIWAFGTASTAGGLGLYNDASLWCWIAPYPSDCKDTLRYGKDEANCERGDNAWMYQWAFYFAPLWLSIIAATYCTLVVYVYVRRIDRRSLKYRRPTELQRMRMSVSAKNNRADATSSFNTVSTSAEQARISQPNSALVHQNHIERNVATGGSKTEPTVRFNANAECDTESAVKVLKSSGRTCSNPRALQAKAELEEDALEDRFLSGRRDSASEESGVGSNSARESFTRSSTVVAQIHDRLKSWKVQRKVQREFCPQTADVANQAVWYLGVFYLTHVWSTSNRILQQVHSGETMFGVILMHSWFDPFQGFLNYLVYQRPRYLFLRKSRPELGRIGACMRLVHFSFLKQRQAQDAISSVAHSSNARSSIASTDRRVSSCCDGSCRQHDDSDAHSSYLPSSLSQAGPITLSSCIHKALPETQHLPLDETLSVQEDLAECSEAGESLKTKVVTGVPGTEMPLAKVSNSSHSTTVDNSFHSDDRDCQNCDDGASDLHDQASTEHERLEKSRDGMKEYSESLSLRMSEDRSRARVGSISMAGVVTVGLAGARKSRNGCSDDGYDGNAGRDDGVR